MIKKLKKYKPVRIPYYIIGNFLSFIRYKFGLTPKFAEYALGEYSIDEAVQYINDVYNDYTEYGKVDFTDKEILEIGHGGTLGVAFNFIANGAKRVYCTDVGTFKKEKKELDVRRKIFDNFNSEQKKRVSSVLNDNFELDGRIVKAVNAGDIAKMDLGFKFDLIVSRAVLEHVSDLETAFKVMDKHLKQGGMMLHVVDLRNHGMFSDFGNHPLYFLRFGNMLWDMMTKYNEGPNRKRITHYKAALDRLGYKYDIYITNMLNDKDVYPYILRLGDQFDNGDIVRVDAIKKRLSRDFRMLKAEDLFITGILIRAEK